MLTLQREVLSTPAGIDAALATAHHEVLVAGTSGPGDPLGRADHDNLRRGVRYRLILPDRVRENPVLALRLGRLAAAGAEVRTLPAVPVRATVVDARLALLPAAQGPELAVVRLAGVVDAMVVLFEQWWASAAPLSGDTGLDARERELLALLSAGCTDESAAARLGVSVRTVRRMMAGIMTRLGARSRFQAGLRAAGTGLMSRVA